MNNLFPPHRDVHETYDLKVRRLLCCSTGLLTVCAGLESRSRVSRGQSKGQVCPHFSLCDCRAETLPSPGAVLKDLNWVRRGRQFELGPEKKAFLEEQLRRDVEMLSREKIMDYSLLVGVHELARGNKDNLREQTLTMFKVRRLAFFLTAHD